MPNIEMLINSISQQFTNTKKRQQAYFSTIDLKYAYSQLQLHKDTAKHCNLNINCGEILKTVFLVLLTCQLNFKKQWTIRL